MCVKICKALLYIAVQEVGKKKLKDKMIKINGFRFEASGCETL